MDYNLIGSPYVVNQTVIGVASLFIYVCNLVQAIRVAK